MSLNPGDKLGPYEILAPIGAGGMGEVYRARDTKLDRDVANRVHIRKRARFVGEIHAAGLVIEEGGYIRGSIDLSRHPAPNLNTSKVEPIRQLSDAVLRS